MTRLLHQLTRPTPKASWLSSATQDTPHSVPKGLAHRITPSPSGFPLNGSIVPNGRTRINAYLPHAFQSLSSSFCSPSGDSIRLIQVQDLSQCQLQELVPLTSQRVLVASIVARPMFPVPRLLPPMPVRLLLPAVPTSRVLLY